MRRIRCALKASVLMFLLATMLGLGCAPTKTSDATTPKTPEKILIGFSMDTLDTPYNAHTAELMQEAWKAHPEVELLTADGQAQSLKQLADIEDFINRGVKAILVKARDEKTLAPVLSRAYKQGIHVVLVQRSVNTEDYSSQIVTDDYECGRITAEFLAKQLNYKGNVVHHEGTPGGSSYLERTKAFRDVMSKYPEIKVIASQTCVQKRTDGRNLMENWLQAFPKIDGIHSNGDEVTIGMVQALEESGRLAEVKCIASIAGFQETIKLIMDGKVHATAPLSTCTEAAVEVAWRLLNGKTVPKIVKVPTFLITKDNAKDLYIPDGYDTDDVDPSKDPRRAEVLKILGSN